MSVEQSGRHFERSSKPEAADTPFSSDQNSIDGQPPPIVLPDAKNFPQKRKREFDADCAKVQSDKVFRTPFFKMLSDRVNGKPLADLVFIEILNIQWNWWTLRGSPQVGACKQRRGRRPHLEAN